ARSRARACARRDKRCGSPARQARRRGGARAPAERAARRHRPFLSRRPQRRRNRRRARRAHRHGEDPTHARAPQIARRHRRRRTMTRDIDRLIEEALAEDERALLAKIGDEPGYFRQARDTFKGPLGWVVWLIYILNIVCF